jgi:hypothetical protein
MKKKQTAQLEQDHECLVLSALYSGHVDSLGMLFDRDKAIKDLSNKAKEHYNAAFKDVFKNKSSTYVRDYLHSFAPHWLAAWFYENDKTNFHKLPKGFGIIG